MRRVFCEVPSRSGLVATLTLNPTLDDTVEVERLIADDVMHALRLALDPGGKGINVSRTLTRLRTPTIAYAPIGGWSGQRLTAALDAEGVPHCFLAVAGETRVNLMVATACDNAEYRFSFAGPPLHSDDIATLLSDMAALLPKPAFWVLGGSLPPGAPPATYAVAIAQAHRQGIPVILDADDEALRLGVRAQPHLIKPNRHELARLVGRNLSGRSDFLAAAREILEQGVHLVLVTLGAEGALAVSREEAWAVTPPPITPLSRIGAGDATVAGMARALVTGEPLVDAARYAVAVGTAAVLTKGTELARTDEIQRLLPMVRAEKL